MLGASTPSYFTLEEGAHDLLSGLEDQFLGNPSSLESLLEDNPGASKGYDDHVDELINNFLSDDLPTVLPTDQEEWQPADKVTYSYNESQIHPNLINAISFADMTSIQKLTMGPILNGLDIVGTAETGSGKTLAFLLPLCHGILANNPFLASADISSHIPRTRGVQCLVLAPTREIAMQTDSVAKSICKHTAITSTVVCGGVRQTIQDAAIRGGVEIVCACPGRLLDLLSRGLHQQFAQLKYLVFDEADRILDLGFLPDVSALVQYLPTRRQTLFFSATMPADVMEVATTYLRRPIIRVGLLGDRAPVSAVDESAFHVRDALKLDFLLALIDLRNQQVKAAFESNCMDNDPLPNKLMNLFDDDDTNAASSPSGESSFGKLSGFGLLLSPRTSCESQKASAIGQALIFARTKARANRVCELLVENGIKADRIHGNRSQSARVKALKDFRNGATRILVATDVAARGIELKSLQLVINFDVPSTPEEYIHRAGRVARASGPADGKCWTIVSEDETEQMATIEQWISRKIPIHPPLTNFPYDKPQPDHIITKSGHNEECTPPPKTVASHTRHASLPSAKNGFPSPTAAKEHKRQHSLSGVSRASGSAISQFIGSRGSLETPTTPSSYNYRGRRDYSGGSSAIYHQDERHLDSHHQRALSGDAMSYSWQNVGYDSCNNRCQYGGGDRYRPRGYSPATQRHNRAYSGGGGILPSNEQQFFHSTTMGLAQNANMHQGGQFTTQSPKANWYYSASPPKSFRPGLRRRPPPFVSNQ